MKKSLPQYLLLFVVLGAFSFATAQPNVTITGITGGVAASPLAGGRTDIAILGVQLSKAGGGGNSVSVITFAMSSTPVGKFTNTRLYESNDNSFGGIGSETFIANGTINAGDISFSGSPLTNFDSDNGPNDEFFFLVVDVNPAVDGTSAAVTPSLAAASVTAFTGTVSGNAMGTAYSFAIPNTAIAVLTTGVVPSPLQAGATGQAVLGFSLTSTGGQTITAIDIQAANASGKWTNFALVKSTDASFLTGGDNTTLPGLTFTPSATEIEITGLNENSTGTTSHYFLVVDVEPTVTGATAPITPSLGASNVTLSVGTASGTATGTAYSFAAPDTSIGLLTTGVAPSPLQAGANGVAVFGFSLTSTATQTVNSINIQAANAAGKWTAYSLVKSTDASFSTGGDNTTVAGLTFTPSGSQIAITGLNENITTAASNYFLVVNVEPTVNASTASITPSLTGSNVGVSPGIASGTATGTTYSFLPLLTIGAATIGVAPSPLVRTATGRAVFGFSLTSSGAQTVTAINVQVTSDPAGKWNTYSLIKSTDNSFTTTVDNSTVTATITPSASQIAIAGALSENITSTPSYYFLVVNVDGSASGNIQASLANSVITLSTGAATGTSTGTNYSFVDPTATFTEITPGTSPVIAGTLLSAGSTLQVLAGFSVTSNGSQTITAIDFDHNGSSTQFAPNEYLYSSTVAGSLGTVVETDGSPDGNFNNSVNVVIQSNPVYFYWVVDVANSVTNGTDPVTPNFSVANVTMNGSKTPFSPAFNNRTFTFGTSQQSDIALNGETTNQINYINFRGNSLNDDGSNSVSLARFQIRDGGLPANDGDNKSTTLTSLQIQLTNFAMVRRVALYDGGTEVSGTEQAVTGANVTFTGLNLSAADNGTRNFNVRATFQNVVTDNAVIQVTIIAAAASSSGSGFTTTDAGGAATPASGTNDIEVIATILNVPASIAGVSTNTPFALTVQARDTQNNLDVDYTGQVGISVASGPGTISPGAQTLTPFLTAGQFAWTDLRLNQSGAHTLSVSDDSFDNDLGDASTTITISSPASAVTTGSTPAIFYGIAFQPLSNIVISETDPAGISGTNGTYTFSISLPAGFVFNQTVVSGVSVSGSDLSAPSNYSYPSVNIAQFSINLNGTSNTNTITISGLQVGHPHPGTVSPAATGPLSITRSGGTLNVAGVVPGTILGSVSASQATPPASVTFTVAALAGDVTVDPNTSSFNVNSNPVNLVGSQGTATSTNVFTGSGITLAGGSYRFNPGSLTSGSYVIKYTHTNGAGSQFVGERTFVVFTSGINGLNPVYCNNAPTSFNSGNAPSGDFTVDPTFIAERTAGLLPLPPATPWQVDYYVYYDPVVSDFVPITNPSNARFDPKLPAYQSVVNYFSGRIPIGFAVCNPGAGYPCRSTTGINANVGVYNTYQWVEIRTAPSPSITVSKTEFCADDASIDLIGVPANSNNTLDDFFSEIGPGTPVSSAGSPVVWSFNPTQLGGAGTTSITYTYKNPATGCSGTSAPVILTVNARPGTVEESDIISPQGISPESCAGTPITTLSATPLTNPNQYRWYSNAALTNLVGAGNSFAPPVSVVNPNIAGVTSLFVTQVVNGCESNKQPSLPQPARVVTVTVKPIPGPPVGNITRNYCVGDNIPPGDFEITSPNNIRWYRGTTLLLDNVSTPTSAQISAALAVSTAAPATYSFQITQTVNGCEGLLSPSILTVNVRPLPSLTISFSAPDLDICKSDQPIVFSAFDNGDPAISGTPPQLGTWSGVAAIVPNPLTGQATLNPALSSLPPGPYTLTFEYVNNAGCRSSRPINFTILPDIAPSLTVGQACVDVPVNIQNTSTIVPASSPSAIVSTSWTFGDGGILRPGSGSIVAPDNNNGRTTGTYTNPQHRYTSVGTFPVNYTMTTSDGCTVVAPVGSITVSPQPQINFKWENPCRDGVSTTVFTAVEGSSPPIAIQTYNWNFNTTGTLPFTGVTGGTTNNPTVNYSNDGRGIARLIVQTAAGCRDTIQKPVYIVPRYAPITEALGYDQDFESNADGWLVGGENPSWALGNLGAPASDNNVTRAWKTNLTGGSNANESSWVLSRCFDFSQATRPVFSFDTWSNTAEGSDGAVLQYNATGNLEDENNWVVVGDLNLGINWYNRSGIINSPGNQSAADRGWSGTFDWQKSIFAIDPLTLLPASQRTSVVFRIAYASAAPGTFQGFSFDNVQVAERSRVVLVESFTNSSTPGISNHNNLFNNFNRAEVVRMQYHTAFPGADPINELNPMMHNSRTAFYGLVEPAAILIDGSNIRPLNAGTLSSAFDNRVLTPSAAKLEVSSTLVSPSEVDINVTLRNISASLPLLTAGTRLFVVVLDSVVNTTGLLGQSGNSAFTYVASDILPSPTGILIPTSIAPNGVLTFPSLRWNRKSMQSVPRIAVFVQRVEGNNKNVLQAILHKPNEIPGIITGVEPRTTADALSLYPNPADRELTIELPAPVSKTTAVQLVDQLGRVAFIGSFAPGEGKKTIDTGSAAGGLYFVQIGSGKEAVRKKVLVVHSE